MPCMHMNEAKLADSFKDPKKAAVCFAHVRLDNKIIPVTSI